MNNFKYFKRWTEEEDQLLLNNRPLMKSKSKWQKISQQLFNGLRNASQCSQRYHRLMHPTQQSIWTDDEDQIIKQYVENNGESKWKNCAELINSIHSGKQIRERWKQVLKPGIKREPWSIQEDKEILKIWQKVGKKWKYMTQQEVLKGRTENQIKNRFHSFVKKFLIETDSSQVLETKKEDEINDKSQNNDLYSSNFELSINTNFNLQLLPLADVLGIQNDQSQLQLLYDENQSNQFSIISHKENIEFDFSNCLDSLNTN